MYYLSYTNYPLAFLAANESNSDTFTCDTQQLITVSAPYSTCSNVIANPQAASAVKAYLKCPIACGNDLLAQFGIPNSSAEMARNAALVWLFGIGFAVCNYRILKYVNHIKR